MVSPCTDPSGTPGSVGAFRNTDVSRCQISIVVQYLLVGSFQSRDQTMDRATRFHWYVTGDFLNFSSGSSDEVDDLTCFFAARLIEVLTVLCLATSFCKGFLRDSVVGNQMI